jgi:hypothetical protein
MKKTLLALTALIVIGSAFAQAKIPLAISCNENNADVYVNEMLLARTGPHLVLTMPAGVYSVRVTKAGFQDYVNPRVVLKALGGTSLDVNLQRVAAAAPAPAPVPARPAPVPARPAPATSAPAQSAVAAPIQPVPQSAKTMAAPAPAPVVTPSAAPAPAPAMTPSAAPPPPAPVQRNTFRPRVVEASFQLNVEANVRGAQVYIDDRLVGRTPLGLNVTRGIYIIRVTAPGYQDFIQRANVHSPMQVEAVLRALLAQLTVTSNIQGADVFINGSLVGQAPYSAALSMGSYSVTVRAPGYFDYQADLSLNGPQTINAALQPALASYRFVVPESFFRKGGKDEGLPLQRRVQLWVDGILDRDFSGQLSPGLHVLRFTAGDLITEAQVEVQAGRSYVFEPYLGINVR